MADPVVIPRADTHMGSLKLLHDALVNNLIKVIANSEATAAHLKVAADLLKNEGVLAAMLDVENRESIDDLLARTNQRLSGSTLMDENGNQVTFN